MKIKPLLPCLFLMIFLISCVDRFVIPSDINTGGTGQFGAGDTTFLQVNPLWDSDFGLDQPEEISISQDGRIFVADKGNNSILVFDQNGSIPEGFEKLKNLSDRNGNEISPIDVDIDKKMNVFLLMDLREFFFGTNIGVKLVLIRSQQVQLLLTIKRGLIQQPSQVQIFGYHS